MSFFGFDATLPRDREHPRAAPGFSQAPDPFAGLSGHDDDDDGIDFEDTYDGLGDQLDETDDAFNDDTFGGGESSSKDTKPVGRDFDYFGQTAKVSGAINEEQVRYDRQQPPPKAAPIAYQQPAYSKPARTGYERYQEPGYRQDLQADPSLWGDAPKKATVAPSTFSQSIGSIQAPGPKMMSLEEVEAAMRAQAKKPAAPIPQPVHEPSPMQQAPQAVQNYQNYQPQGQPNYVQPQNYGLPDQEFMRQTPPVHQQPQASQPVHQQPQPPQPVQILQRPHVPTSTSNQPSQPTIRQSQPQAQPQQPIQIMQNPNRLSRDSSIRGQPVQPVHLLPTQGPGVRPAGSLPNSMLPNLTDEERAAFLLEDAKRAKRNHKIFLLSKDNGLMTPQDKNFITRMQLQQLVMATGDPSEFGTDAALSEDFYYQVHNQIQRGPRQNPNQPLSNFAQTYLFQTGGRHGGSRRQANRGDNHMQRMEQQVQRAVEAAKNKPKNKQLIIEGSLGKISFSNAKTPKPLLNIKRAESGTDNHRPASARAESDRRSQIPSVSGSDRKTVLRDIENVYNTLMEMEDHGRQRPPPLKSGDIDPSLAGANMDWTEKNQSLNSKLWKQLKVHEPIGATTVHPFIAFLSLPKGKKAIPRVFHQITSEQRTTIMTMIAVHLDRLDVVRGAILGAGETQLSSSMRDNIELFSSAVMPSLFQFLSEAGLEITEGMLGLICNQTSLDVDARTRIGVSMLTMILSRAELSKQTSSVTDGEWNSWVSTYNMFFDALEPTLSNIFPGTVNTGEDVYIWQFLAAIGIGASPEQQQRLVMAVKDRVMETVALAKTLPPAMSGQRLANVNLFMRSIGLDVDLLS